MKEQIDIEPDLKHRIETVAKRTGASPSDILTDALENGHSLAWQEAFVRKVKAGIAAAEAGEFATPDEIETVRRKYRPS